MEEILASIRKIISEDSPETQSAQPGVQALAEAEPEVLELTQEVREEPVPAPAAAPVIVVPAPQPVAAPHVDDVVFQSIEEPAAKPAQGIFSDNSRKAFDDVSNRFVRAEAAPTPRDPAAPVAPLDGNTLEALFDRAVRETFEPVLQEWMGAHADAIVERMKPLISEWMDKNFPPLLSAAVEAEFVRSRKAR
jgi:cell pole-organizing protein PopZ